MKKTLALFALSVSMAAMSAQTHKMEGECRSSESRMCGSLDYLETVGAMFQLDVEDILQADQPALYARGHQVAYFSEKDEIQRGHLEVLTELYQYFDRLVMKLEPFCRVELFTSVKHAKSMNDIHFENVWSVVSVPFPASEGTNQSSGNFSVILEMTEGSMIRTGLSLITCYRPPIPEPVMNLLHGPLSDKAVLLMAFGSHIDIVIPEEASP